MLHTTHHVLQLQARHIFQSLNFLSRPLLLSHQNGPPGHFLFTSFGEVIFVVEFVYGHAEYNSKSSQLNHRRTDCL